MSIDTYEIGDVVMSPHEKMKSEEGLDRFDLLLADGSEVLGSEYPMYVSSVDNVITGGTFVVENTIPLEGFTDSVRGTYSDGVHLWIGYNVNGAIKKFNLDGTLVGIYDSGTNNYIQGITEDEDGYLYWVNAGASADAITKADKDCNIIWHRVITSTTANVTGVAYADGLLYIFDTEEDSIHTYTTEAVYIEEVGNSIGNHFSKYKDNYWIWNTLSTSFLEAGISFDSPVGNFTQINDTEFVGVSGTDMLIGTIVFDTVANTPAMNSGTDLVPYRIVADKHTPSIGDVRRSNLEKYSEDGVAMFDYLLCDGSEVDGDTYPILAEVLPKTDMGGWLFSHSKVRDPVPSLDPTATEEPTWDERFNNVGQHTYMSANDFDDFVIPQKTLQIEELGATWGMLAYLTWTSGMVNEGEMDFKDEADNTLYKIGWFNTGIEAWQQLRTSTDGINWIAHPTDSTQATQISGNFTYNDGLKQMEFVSLRTSAHVESFTDSVDLSLCTHVIINGSAKTHGNVPVAKTVFAITLVNNFAVVLPTNTSAYPNFPDRVIADLTTS